MENKSSSARIIVALAIVIVIVGVIWYARAGKVHAPNAQDIAAVQNQNGDNSNGATDTTSTTTVVSIPTTPSAQTVKPVPNGGTPNTSPAPQALSYTNAEHQFTFTYPNGWTETSATRRGIYKDAIALVPTSEEAKIRLQFDAVANNPDADTLIALLRDRALLLRLFKDTNQTALISQLYGPGAVVTTVDVGGKKITKIIRSKESDPTNWQGGSTEAYFFHNTLGEYIVVEANYSAANVPTSGSLAQFLAELLPTFRIRII